MNKNESKYFNTALLMDEALLQLLEKKDFAFISVKEICQKAGLIDQHSIFIMRTLMSY